ncbi:MAG: site-specific DNA-methyltransferase [Tenericutes bacterium]|nr:site-specific DNA-methyltransferase [Mycoplasmatota bacterium]
MKKVEKIYNVDNDITLHLGDSFDFVKRIPNESISLVITSPPYAMGKAYERPDDDIGTFIQKHIELFPEIYRILKPGGSICWQVGYHVKDMVVTPLDIIIGNIISDFNNTILTEKFILRNRIIWTFGHGLNSFHRFSGRHETILWYTKGDMFEFDLDSVRVPQKYPGKKYYKGEKKGEFSGNPLGKNPSDVWSIPNVKAKHVEKTDHPCQYPVVIPQRLIKALTRKNDIIFDPFNGVGSTGVAAILENRRYIGVELYESYYDISLKRLQDTINGTVKYRKDEPIYEPKGNSAVLKKPEHFKY